MENTKITAEELQAYDAEAQMRLRKHCEYQAFLDLSLAVLHSSSMQNAFKKYQLLRKRPVKDLAALRVMLNRYRRLGILEKSEHGEPIPYRKLKAQIYAIAHPTPEEATAPTEKSDLYPTANDVSA